jgi:hypothetical protein
MVSGCYHLLVTSKITVASNISILSHLLPLISLSHFILPQHVQLMNVQHTITNIRFLFSVQILGSSKK